MSDARARMVTAAEHLFRVQGLHATGLSEILQESGAPRGSLYHYFPGGKEQLATETLEEASRRIERGLREFVAGSGSVPDGMRRYGAAAAERLLATDFAEGCPIGNTALEASTLSPAMREVCDAALRSWEAVVADTLVDAGVDSEEAASLATFVVLTFEGALLVARARRSTVPMEDAAEQLALIVERAINR